MAAGRRLPAFCAVLAALALLLFFFSDPFLLWVIAVLFGIGLLSALLLWADSRRLRLTLCTASGGRAGQPLRLTLEAGPSRFLAAARITVELETESVMFGASERRRLLFPLRGGQYAFSTELTPTLCGETCFRCAAVSVSGPLDLFRFRCRPFAEARTVLYPQPAGLELILSRETVGAADAEGLMQNRRGSDPSEIFDIRDYVPGDDVRTIHWKLSCKTDGLIVRQASDPSHYDVALLPDLGLAQKDRKVTAAELNSAVAAAIALGEGLLSQGTAFCLAIPTSQGLMMHEVRSLRRLHDLLPQWMGLQVPAQSGVGLECFRMEHLDQHFTRLLVVSAGKYSADPAALSRRIGVTVVSTADGSAAPAYAALGAGCELVVLPARAPRDETYRIVC